MNLPLFTFSGVENEGAISNWFIVSDPHDPILTLVRDLHYAYWKDYDYLMHYFIFHMFFYVAANAYKEEWSSVPFISNQPPFAMHYAFSAGETYSEARMKYFESVSDFHKLTYKTFALNQWEPDGIIPHIIENYRPRFEH